MKTRWLKHAWVCIIRKNSEKGIQPMSSEQPKKMSLQELVKQQLENKKNNGGNGKNNLKGDTSTKKLTSQQTKKTSNTRRKMGV